MCPLGTNTGSSPEEPKVLGQGIPPSLYCYLAWDHELCIESEICYCREGLTIAVTICNIIPVHCESLSAGLCLPAGSSLSKTLISSNHCWLSQKRRSLLEGRKDCLGEALHLAEGAGGTQGRVPSHRVSRCMQWPPLQASVCHICFVIILAGSEKAQWVIQKCIL